MVRYKHTELPELTEAQRLSLAELANLPDESIDYSDIPSLTDEQLANAVRGRFYRPVKIHTTVRLDSDILLWLKSQGKGYQTRINEILRSAMMNQAGRRRA